MIETRSATPAEVPQLGAIAAYVFSGSVGHDSDNVLSRSIAPEWTHCAFDGARMVASYAVIPFTMRANGVAVRLGGVSAVGTLPEYRRQGLVRRLSSEAIEQMRDRGQAVAGLWASQAGIYQRYGYAMAAPTNAYTIDVADIVFADGDGGRGDVERHKHETALDLMREVYTTAVADRMCALHRSSQIWDMNVLNPRGADGPVHVAVSRDDGGAPDGYVAYTVQWNRVDHRTRDHELIVHDLAWLTPSAYRSLWGWIARHDLVGRVHWNQVPADDPAPYLLAEPRLLHIEHREGVLFRVVDVAAAFAGRGYDRDGTVAIDVGPDPLAPWNEGRWTLTVDGGVGRVGAGGDGSLRIQARALASLYTGHLPARRLRQLGWLDGPADVIADADRLFATRHAPALVDDF